MLPRQIPGIRPVDSDGFHPNDLWQLQCGMVRHACDWQLVGASQLDLIYRSNRKILIDSYSIYVLTTYLCHVPLWHMSMTKLEWHPSVKQASNMRGNMARIY